MRPKKNLVMMKPNVAIGCGLVLLICSTCRYREYPDWAFPNTISGILMAGPDSIAANALLEFELYAWNRATGDQSIIQLGETTTDAEGNFIFQYNRGNQRTGEVNCGNNCRRCDGILIWHNNQLIGRCFKSNVSSDFTLYLSDEVNLELTYETNSVDTDTIFFSMAPIDTNHPNFYRESEDDHPVLLITASANNVFVLEYETRMTHPEYVSWSGGKRGNSFYIYSRSYQEVQSTLNEGRFIDVYPSFFGRNNIDLNIELRSFFGAPFTDTLSLN